MQYWYMPGADLTPKLRWLNWYRPWGALIIRNSFESLSSRTYRNADLKSNFVNFLLWLRFVYRSSIFSMGYESRLVHLFTLSSPHRWIDGSILRIATIWGCPFWILYGLNYPQKLQPVQLFVYLFPQCIRHITCFAEDGFCVWVDFQPYCIIS